MAEQKQKSVAIVGAGVFGLSLAVALSSRQHKVTVFDQNKYDESGYAPFYDTKVQAASVDHNKIFRASYGAKIQYQRLALESRQEWERLNKNPHAGGTGQGDNALFHACGMLRVQPSDELSTTEKETLANMERDGQRHAQFVKSNEADRQRARDQGWDTKLLDFNIPDTSPPKTFEAVLDSLAGFTRCSEACACFYRIAKSQGVTFRFGPREGAFKSMVEEKVGTDGQKKAVGLKTKDDVFHRADIVVIAAGSFSTQLLPELAYHLESSGGSVAMFKIDKDDTALWDKYSPQRFPVITWKREPRNSDGKDFGSIYVLPRTPDGLVKIGYRGVKFTNFRPAPENASFDQNGLWSVPVPPAESTAIPEHSREAIRDFASVFLPEFDKADFYATRMCWYTDSLDNSFLIDYVPTYAENTVFVCTGGSGHGAKFLPVLGKHAADILENGEKSTTFMRPHWRWREDAHRGNGLEEGPGGPRNLGLSKPRAYRGINPRL